MIGAGNGSVTEITGGVIFAVLTLIGLISNMLLIIVLITGRSHFKGIYFYTLAYQLIICDFLIYASQIGVVIPVFLMDVDQIEAYINSIFFDILINLHTIGFYGFLHFNFLIALNCYIVIATKNGAALLTPMLRKQLIAATWILTAGLSAIGIYLCLKNLDYYGLYIFKDCNNSGESGRAYRRFAYVWTLGLPLVMFLMYVFVFVKLKTLSHSAFSQANNNSIAPGEVMAQSTANMSNNQGRQLLSKATQPSVALPNPIKFVNERLSRVYTPHGHLPEHNRPSVTNYNNNNKSINNSFEMEQKKRANKRETKLIIQAAITCAALEIGIIAFNVLPLIADIMPSNISIWITITQNCFVIVCNSVQPVVFFKFNTEIRRQLKSLFSCH